MATRDKQLTRLDRDSLLHLINTRRFAIQHAADSIWPATEEPTRPIRKTLPIPQNRAETIFLSPTWCGTSMARAHSLSSGSKTRTPFSFAEFENASTTRVFIPTNSRDEK